MSRNHNKSYCIVSTCRSDGIKSCLIVNVYKASGFLGTTRSFGAFTNVSGFIESFENKFVVIILKSVSNLCPY